MIRYRIIVEQRVSDDKLAREDDRRDNPAGRYLYAAETADEALDLFHSQIPIGCLDDFDVRIEVFEKVMN